MLAQQAAHADLDEVDDDLRRVNGADGNTEALDQLAIEVEQANQNTGRSDIHTNCQLRPRANADDNRLGSALGAVALFLDNQVLLAQPAHDIARRRAADASQVTELGLRQLAMLPEK